MSSTRMPAQPPGLQAPLTPRAQGTPSMRALEPPEIPPHPLGFSPQALQLPGRPRCAERASERLRGRASRRCWTHMIPRAPGGTGEASAGWDGGPGFPHLQEQPPPASHLARASTQPRPLPCPFLPRGPSCHSEDSTTLPPTQGSTSASQATVPLVRLSGEGHGPDMA